MWRVVSGVVLLLGAAGDAPAQLPSGLGTAVTARTGPVEAEMRNVDYRVGTDIVLRIAYLRGALVPTSDAPPWFEDPSSFVLSIDSAASLAALLNSYTFHYDGSPLRGLEIRIAGTGLELEGTLDKTINLPFKMRVALHVTQDGRLRLRPSSVRVAGIGVRGLMRTFSIELDDMVKVRGGRGVMVHENDFYLSPAELLPPPRIRGRLQSLRLSGDTIIQTFVDRSRRGRARPLARGNLPRNYMFYRGNLLRFGKLMMHDADLLIVDQDPRDPFDFFLARLNDQLVAGATRNEPDFGLVTAWPDFHDLRNRRR